MGGFNFLYNVIILFDMLFIKKNTATPMKDKTEKSLKNNIEFVTHLYDKSAYLQIVQQDDNYF